MSWLYRLGIGLYHSVIRLLAVFGNKKAKAWVTGRQLPIDWQRLDELRVKGPVIWMHVASLGEFEQGRPVLDLLRKELADQLVIVLSFYSPSGFVPGQKYQGADLVVYLPADSKKRAHQWLQRLRPDLAIFVKYEFWHYHLQALAKSGVSTYLIAAAFRPNQLFFRSWGGWWRKMLFSFQGILVQTAPDRDLLLSIGFPADRVTLSGDPRIDRTLELANTPWSDPILDEFSQDPRPLIIAGSVWPPDVDRLLSAWPKLKDKWRLLLVPHQLVEKELQQWKAQFQALRYSQIGERGTDNCAVLILDTIGMLSRCYRYGKIAYIGGGFGTSIHNSLEPMAYGLPVLFGPKIRKFPEAVRMVAEGGAKVIQTGSELLNQVQSWEEASTYDRAKRVVNDFMGQNKGAAQRTLEVLRPVLER